MTRIRTLTLTAAAVAVALTAAACSSPTGGGAGDYAAAADVTTPATAVGSTVTSAALGPGTALVDGTGRALYLFDGDTGTASTCDGACASVWPPLPAPADPPTATGTDTGPNAQLGSTPRSDGTTQLTYHGHPLYYYVGDQKPGETRGQGLDQFGAHWYLVQPDGAGLDND